MITYEQREEAYNSATNIQQEMYAGPGAGFAICGLATKNNIASTSEFAIAVGDVILGLVPQEKLPELLMERLGVERAPAMRITADVLDFLAPLDQPESTTVATTTAVPINTTSEPTNDNSLATEIAEAEATMQALEPIKTMRHDMEVVRSQSADEPVHTTKSQADLLDHAAAVRDKNPDSRWNTEQS